MNRILALFACAAGAQSYSIGWFTIDSNGGTSTNGQYSVSGTIGQPDAGHMARGNFTLNGGFWSIITAVQTPGSPLLTISSGPQPGTVTVSWPSPSTGFNLQESASLSPQAWNTIPATNADNGTFKRITVSTGPGNKFYRLKQ